MKKAPDMQDATNDRRDDLEDLIAHCKAAEALAGKLDRRFLAYLIAMAIEEAHGTTAVRGADSKR